jgi:hypothetical protein
MRGRLASPPPPPCRPPPPAIPIGSQDIGDFPKAQNLTLCLSAPPPPAVGGKHTGAPAALP